MEDDKIRFNISTPDASTFRKAQRETLASMASAARKAQQKPSVACGWWFPRAFMLGYSADGDGRFLIYLGFGWVSIAGKR